MKKSNKLLLGLLGLLVIIYFITEYLKKHDTDTHYDVDVVNIDSVNVERIEITPGVNSSQKSNIALAKESSQWKVYEGEKSDAVSESSIKDLLATLHDLKVQRLVAKNESKWEKYKVNDSLASKVKIQQSSGDNLEFYLGGFVPQGGTSTYVRFKGNENVYSVKGLLTTVFEKSFDNWRDNLISKFKNENISKLNFEYLGIEGESYILMKNDSLWNINEEIAKDEKVTQYLNRLTNKTLSDFADDFAPNGSETSKVTLSSNDMNEFSLLGYKEDSKYYVSSTLNQDTYFSTDSTQYYNIFANKNFFTED